MNSPRELDSSATERSRKARTSVRLTANTFHSYANALRLTENVRLAAYDVLVNGAKVSKARAAHDVSTASVYRAIGELLKPHAPKLARAGYDVPEHRLAALDKLVHAQLDVWLIEDEEEAARAAEVLRNGGDGAGLTYTPPFVWD